MGTFYRIHWEGSRTFSRKNAWSADWGYEGDVPPKRGYSCYDDPERLYDYMMSKCIEFAPDDDDTELIIFAGDAVGVGPEGEDLALPRKARPVLARGPAHILVEVTNAYIRAWNDAIDRGQDEVMAADAAAVRAVKRLTAR